MSGLPARRVRDEPKQRSGASAQAGPPAPPRQRATVSPPAEGANFTRSKKVVIMASEISKSWFAVLNNPADHGYPGPPEEVCQKLRDEWTEGSNTRAGAWAYCISAEGLHHVHMVLEDRISMRFSKIKKTYAAGMHFEATRGNKEQAEDYINKRGKFEEKGERVLFICRAGEIQAAQGKRSDLEEIAAMLEAGHTPSEIMEADFSYRRYERMIRSAYFDKRKKETPLKREVKVHYLVGESGSGKSYTYVTLCEEHGEEAVYLFSDYEGGGFDAYQGQAILFIDEMKGQFLFGFLLQILDGYKIQVHARFANIWALWTDVFITSVFPPEELYQKMVEESARGRDKQQQLLRRITDITYCFTDAAGEYQRYTIPMAQYVDYEELKAAAMEHMETAAPEIAGFTEEAAADGEDLPF